MGNEFYYYNIYGLNVKSQIRIDEAEVCRLDFMEYIDVRIIISKISYETKMRLINSDLRSCYKDEIYFSIDNVANFYILNGQVIIVEPIYGSDDYNIRSFILGHAFGRLFKQRDIVAIHGGAISIGEKSIIVGGESNAGKTALTTGFLKNGCGFLSDDVVVIDFDNHNKPVVIPSYPYQKLRCDTAKYLNIDIEDSKKTGRLCRRVDSNFINKPVILDSIFVIVPDCRAREVTVKKVVGMEKLDVFYNNIYIKSINDYVGISKVFFESCMDILSNINIYHIIRPINRFTVNEQIKKILEIL